MTMPVGLAFLTVAMVGCGGLVDPGRTCAEQAADYGPDFSVAGAFATTAGRIRTLYPTAGQQIPDIDGGLPKGPPPDNERKIAPSFDRAVVAVVNETAIPLVLGCQDDIPVTDPTE